MIEYGTVFLNKVLLYNMLKHSPMFLGMQDFDSFLSPKFANFYLNFAQI